MKKAFWISFVIAAVLGSAWHFLYDVLPCPLTALLAPINESVWEHLKLLFFPPLVIALVLSFLWKGSQRRFWSSALAAVIAMPVALCFLYITLTEGFGLESCLYFDIGLYYVLLLLGWVYAGALLRTGKAEPMLGALVVLSGLFFAAFLVFSLAPPRLPVFIPKA